MAKPKQPTVTTAARQGWTADQIRLRAYAAACALSVFGDRLAATDARLRTEEKTALTEATQAYRGPMREDHANPPSDSIKADHYTTACAGLAAHDATLEANSIARSNRKAERARVTAALREYLTAKPGDDRQMELPGVDDKTGLGLYTEDARALAYTALLELDKAGTLDEMQRELMVDLAGAGVAVIGFVLDAADAIEDATLEPEAEGLRSELAQLEQQANNLPI